jgi:uncharacterized protein (TIGR03437 family)
MVLASLVLCAGSLSADTVETVFFRQSMTTANEVPPVEGATASARAIIAAHVRRNDSGEVVSGVVDFDIQYTFGEPVSITGLHIHGPDAPAGVNASVVINSGITSGSPVAAEGTGDLFYQVRAESGNALAALIGLLANPQNYYVNLHTTTFTGGIIRAQLTRAEKLVLRSIMSPANEVPPVEGLDASGSGSIFIIASRDEQGAVTGGTVSFDVSYSFPAPVTLRGLHIHPGLAGENGPVAINSTLAQTDTDAIDVTSGALRRRVEVASGAALDALRLIYSQPAEAYLNIHTTANTGGAMRGQLEPTAETSLQLAMSPANEVPPIEGLEASALAKVTVHVTRNAAGEVTSGTAIFDVSYSFPGSVEFRGFHIHAAAAGTNGGVVIGSDLSSSNTVVDEDGVGNLYKIIDVGPTNANGLATLQSIVVTPENQYLNLHTTVHTGGAIRGQLISGPLPMPSIPAAGIVSAVNVAGVVAASPGSLITIYGANLARFTAVAAVGSDGRLPANLAGAEVRIGTASAPLLYVSPLQINAQVPFDTTAGTQSVTVTTGGGVSTGQNITVETVSPAIFVVVKNSDFSLVTASNPVQAGDDLAIFATGLGAVSPAVASGQPAPASPLSSSTAAAIVTIGGVAAEVSSPTPVLAPGFVGVYQVNVRVAAGTPAGTQPLSLSIGGQTSNSVSIVVQ